MPKLTRGLTGKWFGDKGYLSQKLFESLLSQAPSQQAKNKLMPLQDKLLLRKRALIETIPTEKHLPDEHTRHRSVANFMVNLVAGLIVYTWQPKKPSLALKQALPDVC